jgi:hypothetical protein
MILQSGEVPAYQVFHILAISKGDVFWLQLVELGMLCNIHDDEQEVQASIQRWTSFVSESQKQKIIRHEALLARDLGTLVVSILLCFLLRTCSKASVIARKRRASR